MQKQTAIRMSEAARAEKLAYENYWHACRRLAAGDTSSIDYPRLESDREETRQNWLRAYAEIQKVRNEAIEEALEIPY